MTDPQNTPFEQQHAHTNDYLSSSVDHTNTNLQAEENTINKSVETSAQQQENSYTYTFNPTTTPKNPPYTPSKKEKSGFWGRILFASITVMLAAAVSFVAAFAGTVIANQIKAETPAYDAPKNDQLHQNDPDELLIKNHTEASVFGSAGDEAFSVSQVVNMVKDAVVVIDVKIQVSSIYGTQTSTSAGSGVIISADGYILTCHHVIESAKEIVVTLNSGSRYAASLVGSDESTDLAVIRIMPQENEPLTFVKQGCSDNLAVGEKVVAIGNSLGQLGGTVTDGIISATEREIKLENGTGSNLLQTNAAINKGNSGGGLFNLDGELIGIVNAKISSSGVEGLAFAIPIDRAYTVELDLIQYGYVRGVVDHGLTTVDVTQSNLNMYYIRYQIDTVGVYIVSSLYDSQSLLNKDRIVSINGTEISTTDELNAILKQFKVGDSVELVIEREDLTFSYTLTLREYVPDYLTTQID